MKNGRLGNRPSERQKTMTLETGQKVRVGFIGAGNWAQTNHMPVLQACDDVVLAGVATPTKESRDLAVEKFGFPYATSDYRELLEQPIDALVIASPHGFHYEQSKASLESGRHVLVEKPLTLRAAEAWDLVETANANGLVLSIPTGWHYNRMVAAAKERMDQGAVGEVEYVVCHMGSALRALYMGQKWPYPMEKIPDPETFYSDPDLAGGGQGYSQLSHSVAILFWLTGLRGSEVFAYMSGAGAPVEMYDAIVAKFDNGSIATISAAGTQPSSKPKHEMDIRIYGSEGELSLDLFHEHLTIHRDDGDNFELEVELGEGDYACDGPPNRFIDLILGRSRENWSPGEISARTVELLEAAYRSAAGGRAERVVPGS